MRVTPCLCAAALLAFGACTKENTPGRVSFSLYDCDAAAGACATASPERIEVPAIVTPQGSRFASGGVRVLAQFARAGGVTGVLSLDLAPGLAPSAAYTEWSAGKRVFDAPGQGGKVVMASDLSGRFSLRFVEAGPDGLRGTDDDQVRTLLDGAYWRSPAAATSVAPLPDLDLGLGWIDVEPYDPGGDPAADSSGCGGDSSSDPPASDPSSASSSGCGSSSSDPSSDPSSYPSSSASSGCGGSSEPSPSDSSSSGCGGGSSSSSDSSSSGCGGGGSDGSSSAGGCGAAQAPSGRQASARRRGGGGGGRFYPALGAALLVKLRPRRRRGR